MSRKNVFSCITPLAALLAASVTARAAEPAPKTGTFETTFTTRSPLSDMNSLCKRLSYPAPTADYDLAKQSFFVHVPETYDPQKPPGLLVIANYKHSDSLPTPVLPQLDQANLIVVTAEDFPDQSWQRAGTSLDAVHNLRQQYTIDPRRIYILGGAEPVDPALHQPPAMSERLALNYPEVFTGSMCINLLPYRPVRAANGGFYEPEIPMPDPTALRLAKTHPFVFMPDIQPDVSKLFAQSFTEDGFKYIKFQPITLVQFHYPNYTTDWLPAFIKFLDAATATLPLPTTQPTTTTHPATTHPLAH